MEEKVQYSSLKYSGVEVAAQPREKTSTVLE